ncbi:DUF2267 domain-containing protein [Xanthobacter sp. V2C-8]|uniref:DUF2267 domain-containing protein n=1 Tax=Xanthobacter albus TaxID=3119929 RepID=UPI00372CBF83
MDELVARLTARLNLTPATARGVVGLVLHFLDHEAPAEVMQPLLDAHPWIPELVSEIPCEPALPASERHFGGMGRLMQVADRMMALGLTMPQVQAAVRETVAYARETVGSEPVDRLVRAVPGLRQVV